MAVRTRLNSRGMQQLLNSGEVEAFLRGRIESALSAARSSAPVATGAYRDSLRVEIAHTDRVVARVVSDVDHAMIVEADTGNLARALDAAG